MKIQEKTWERLLLVALIALAALMLIRVFFGTEQTDEAYYIADVKGVLEGNLPYAFNSSQAAGMTFLMLPFFTLYKLLVSDLTGVFLYMRICYVIFRMAIIALILWLLRHQYSRKIRLMAGSVLIVWFGSGIQNFSYNSIASLLLLLTGVLMASALENGEAKTVYRAAILAGVLMALTELAHIAMAPNVILIGLLIWLLSAREQRWKALGCYLLGGFVIVIVIFGTIGILAGFDRLLYGLESFLFYNVKIPNQSSLSVSNVIISIFISFFYLWKNMVFPGFAIFVVCLLWQLVKKKPLDLERSICIGTLVALLAGSAYLLRYGWTPSLLECVGAMTLIGCIGCLSHRPPRLFWFVAFPSLLITLVLAFNATSSNPPSYRFISLVPVLFAVLLTLGKQVEKRPERWILYAITALSVLVLVKYDYGYVYRDEALSELTAQVEHGIYAGLYTTPQRAKDMPELESYLKEVTEPGEKILFRDNVPAGYLMHNGVICDIRTWDHLQYSYGCNNPTALYRYFLNREQIPDKIIYVDYGRDEQLSIEDPEYKFNDFVHTFYSLDDEQTLNESYRVKVYCYNGPEIKVVFQWLLEKMS